MKRMKSPGVLVIAVFCLGVVGCNFQELGEEENKRPGLPEPLKATITTYNYYYGSLHNHSNVSDGTGTPATAYKYARDTAGMDFFSLADHAGSISSTEWTDIKNQANNYNQDGVFVTFWGFEWSHSTLGHVTIINTTDYCTESQSATNTFPELVTWLNARDGAAFFNHPGRQDNGNEFNHFTSAPSAKFVGMELWNKTDGFNVYYYNDGYYSNDGNKGYFDEALVRNWKIGAAGAHDNHSGTWGTETDYRHCILATSLTRTSLYNALHARRFFSTADKNLRLYFDINGAVMGSTLAPGSYTAHIQAADGNSESFNKVELLKNGAVLYTWNINQTAPQLTYNLTTLSGEYYYVRVAQPDGNQAISSPVFISGTNPTATPTATPTSAPTATPTATPTSTPTPSPTATTRILERRISSGNDDAEEQGSGYMYLTSSDLEFVYDASVNQKVGMRFTNITIPRSTVIKKAYIQFKVDEATSTATSLTIKGHAADNSATFSSTAYDISNRTTTSAGVNWSPTAWSTVGATGTAQRTPELKTVIQEIINRSGWASGNSLTIIITGTGERVAEAYNGDSAGAPLLHIEF